MTFELEFDDADPVVTCECGWHAHGDAVIDALTSLSRHLPDCEIWRAN